ncbi:MAG TPA: 3'-5' exonuclease, partial [Patescibacteria group bacterium]|nr:3'-5' exonuclease [Patescibacteria group bacterium]
ANIYHAYQQLLLQENAMDFGDLIVYAVQLLQQRQRARSYYQEKFHSILVDEFQDTNWAQYELIKLLAGEKKNIMVVGDDDQAIYKFRGASVSNILSFKKDFSESTDIVLTQNYRSKQNILDAAYALIQHNNPDRLEAQLNTSLLVTPSANGRTSDGAGSYTEEGVVRYENHPVSLRETPLLMKEGITPISPPYEGGGRGRFSIISKKLISQSHEAGIVEHIHCATLDHEVQSVVALLKQRYSAGVAWKDMALLVRANDSADPFCRACGLEQIPYQFWAQRGLYRTPVVLDIFAYINLLDNYHDAQSCYRLLTTPIFAIRYEDISCIQQYMKKKAVSFFEALKDAQLIPSLSDSARERIQKLLHLISRHTALLREYSAGQIIDDFMQESGYMKFLSDTANGPASQEQRTAIDALWAVGQLYQRIAQFEESHEDKHLKYFTDEIKLERESGNNGRFEKMELKDEDAVNILTVHSAKGLEFDTVCVVNMVEQKFPTTNRGDRIPLPDALIHETLPTGDEHLQEERRLFYVAMTRAKNALYLTSADDYGGARKKKMSRFIQEAEIPILKSEIQSPKAETQKVELQTTHYQLPTINIRSLSHTKLQSFATCPLKYKYEHILKVPIVEGTPMFSFGTTMHTLLQKAFSLVQDRASRIGQTDLFGASVSESDGSIVLEEKALLRIYDQCWIDDWYSSKKQRDEYYKKGKEIIASLIERYKGGWPVPIALEKMFEFPVMNNGKRYALWGRIDRIDPVIIDGAQGVEIIDYKTGTPKNEKISTEDKQQLLLYQIAVQEVLGYIPLKLTYHYLEDDSMVSFIGTQGDLDQLQNDIKNRIQEMELSTFPATPGYHCQWCPFNKICDFSDRT